MKVLFLHLVPRAECQIIRFQQGLGSISAVVKRSGHQTALLIMQSADRAILDNAIARHAPDLVGISLTSNFVPLARELAGILWKDYKLPLVLGGVHPTLCPEECIDIPGVFAVCRGEGEFPMLELCEALEHGADPTGIANLWMRRDEKLFRNEIRPLIEDLDALPFPDRELFPFAELLRQMPEAEFMGSRGCPFKCSYCVNHALLKLYRGKGSFVRHRSPAHLLGEIAEVTSRYTVEFLGFHDDTFTLDSRWLAGFCSEYPKRFSYPFWCNSTANAINEKNVDLLKKAGCYEVRIGIESGNDELRRRILQKNVSRESIIRAFSLLREAGIRAYAFNMIGLPHETADTIRDTIELNRIVRPDSVFCSIFYPYPGTEARELCHRKGWLSDRATGGYFDGEYALDQPGMNPRELVFCRGIFQDIVRWPRLSPLIRILHRIPVTSGKSLWNALRRVRAKAVQLGKLLRPKSAPRFQSCRTAGSLLLGVFLLSSAAAEEQRVTQWGLYEKELVSSTALSDEDKYAKVMLTATFVCSNSSFTVPGFWDGEDVWRIRFAPPTAGVWTYSVRSNDEELAAEGNGGAFVAIPPSREQVAANPNYRGFLQTSANNRHFVYADGTPFFWMGGTLWDGNSINMPFEDFAAYVANRKERGFTAIQILVAEPNPPTGTRNRRTGFNINGPLFEGGWLRLNPRNLQEFDRRIAHIADNGMVPVIFFNWGPAFNTLTIDELHAYHRHLVARYQPWNVVWCISGEYRYARSLHKPVCAGRHVRRIDGLSHLIAAHPGPNTMKSFCSSEDFFGEPWLDFHMQHTWRRGDERDWMSWAYSLKDGPVVNAEAGYDGLWDHDRERVRREAWTVYMSGGAGYTYGAYGVSYPWNNGCCDNELPRIKAPRWQHAIALPSAVDMKHIVDFFSRIEWWKMAPAADAVSQGYALANGNAEYVVYLPAGGSTEIFELPEHHEAAWYNPRDGSTTRAKGPVFAAPDSTDWVLHVSASS